MELADGLAWLDRHINLEATAGKVESLSLDRMRRLAEALGDPQHAYPVIHITGTNGKGSTARMISALLAESGLSVGTYTSPHLQHINERIARNLEPVTDDELAGLLSDIADLEQTVELDPSYFEILTAAAFRWFSDVAVDVAVVEVGLLGRYDATNVADGTVAVVTNVGHDHSDYEGEWGRAIASEKAGIIKPGSVVVLGETDPELVPIFLDEDSAGVWLRGVDFGCERNDVAVGGRVVDLRTPGGVLEQVYLPLHGAHQGDNAAIAVAATEAFFGRPLAEDVVAGAFAGITMPGRFEVIRRNPLVVLDGAHNADGAAAAARTLADDFVVHGQTILVVGMLAPRKPAEVLEQLDAAGARLVIGCTAASPRAVPAQDIAAVAEALGGQAVAVADVADAVDAAMLEAGEDDAVLITGSLYVVGAARDHLVGGK